MYSRPRPDFLSRCFTPDEEKFRHGGIGGNSWITLPSRQHFAAITPLQQAALDEFGQTDTDGKPPFPYIEDVKSIINTTDCINQDLHLLLYRGRR